ncbi:hypothetical protein BS50DRAFT_474757, partial [Corynespora cassiicola Philippines]
WRPEPTERGTFNILSTCVLTLVLCVWTSLHLNVPEHGKVSKQKWNKTLWLFVGLFMPEVVASIAFDQWRSARKLHLEMSKILDSRLPQDPPHYALMGGFAFDTSGMKLSILPENRTRLTLAEQGLLELARRDLIPDISEENIKDKSKANELAKTLVCLQAVWFCIQVIGRLATHYPISLLEMNTFAHAICCLCIYAAWWHKPLDIDEPTLIPVDNEDVAKLCAWMTMNSIAGCRRKCQANFQGKQKKGETWYLFWVTWVHGVFDALFHRFPDPIMTENGLNDDVYIRSKFKLKLGTLAAMSLYGSLHLLAWTCPFSNGTEQVIWRASSIFLSIPLPGYFLPHSIGFAWLICMKELGRKKTSSSLLTKLSEALGLILTLLGLLGWLCTLVMCLPVILFYPLARVYVLVECFRNLWFLSQDVYKVPAWTRYIPHF